MIGLESSSICPSCFNKITLNLPFVTLAGNHSTLNTISHLRIAIGEVPARTEKHYFDKARSLGKYEGVFKKTLISCKYKGRKKLLKDFITICLQPQNNYYFIPLKKGVDKTDGIDLIFYVPLHKKKLRTRGFDQAFLIAKEISKLSNISLKTDFLFKKKDTPPQAALKKQIRIKNLKGAFHVKDSSFLEEKNVLLVDDVITTGATVNECSKVLKQHGTNRVEVFTLARAA